MQLKRRETVYSPTSLLLPCDLKTEAQKLGINLSKTLVDALETEVKQRKTGVKA
jgi:post-segregation antitoxin (ccd killing protein)